ncbi:GntR family transcriptional regulator [Streptomyces sp. NPDC008343]|uniref:GntR family transcriptional regulator n=1 Tax=Streptomyces sp. NPDC008343 TaxID=3364828 RepID=UPI0036E8AE46
MNSRWVGRLPAAKSKADLVHASLRAAIAAGELKPGERINMDELARTFGVSKIPVREAVKRLESEGLAVSRPHAGATVTALDTKEMRGVFLAREQIDGLVGELATRNMTPDLLEELVEVHLAMREAVDAGNMAELPDLNSVFHGLLATAAGYRILSELTEQLMLAIRRYRIIEPMDDQSWRSVLDEHEVIVQALGTGDAQAAAEAARAHTASQSRHEVAEEDTVTG